MGEVLRQPELAAKKVEFRTDHREINDLALNFQRTENEAEKRKYAEELWKKMGPLLRRNLERKGYPNADDVMQDFYESRFINAASKWKEEGGNFASYCFTAVDNLVRNQFGRSKRAEEINKSLKESVYEVEMKTKRESDLALEDKITIKEIKSSLLNLIERGVLSPVEGMVVVLKFGLGKEMVRVIASRFEAISKGVGKKVDHFEQLRNADLESMDLSSGMVDIHIAKVLRKRNGDVPEIVENAISKIKTELK